MKTKIVVIVVVIALIIVGFLFKNPKRASYDYDDLNKVLAINVKPEKCIWEVHKLGNGRSSIGPTDYSYTIVLKYNSNSIASFRSKIQESGKRTDYLKEDIIKNGPRISDYDEIEEEINEMSRYEPKNIESYMTQGSGFNGLHGEVFITKNNTVIMFLVTL